MKTYGISYHYMTYSDAKIAAKTKEEAIKLLKQVLPEIEIEDIRELKDK